METNVILKYRRELDSWICPECESENVMTLGKCSVCGALQTPDAAIAKHWTEADEVYVAPVSRHVAGPTSYTPYPSTPVFRDTGMDAEPYVTEEKGNTAQIIWGIIIVTFILILLIVLFGSNDSYAAYSDAMEAYETGDYETAIEMFEELPEDYKDVSYMLDESKYQCAMKYLGDGDFTEAESLFESISYHNDSAEKVDECKYQAAYELFNYGSYADAKEKFQAISHYSDSQDMVEECDYEIAMNYFESRDYVDAMKAFDELGSYADSARQFTAAENALIYYNSRNGYYTDEESMVGDWTNNSNDYIYYTLNGDGSMNSSYSLSNTDGEYFKVTDGVHYHGDDYSGWEKQWIFQRVDSYSAKVYNYIDGEIYYLSK